MKRLKRSDSLLLLLVIILASLITTYCDEGNAALLPEQSEPLATTPTAPEPEKDTPPLPKAGAPVRFLMHNVANYFVPGERQRSRYTLRLKSEQAKEAVAELLAHANPEVAGLIEIGGPVALNDLLQRLTARGVEYPHHFVLTRQGEDRALALLSRHPIVENNSRADVKLYNEQRRRMLRGILDVTVELPDGRRFRIIGAHLKSRVSSDAAAATALRSKEAHTLAMHIQQAVRQQPNMPMLVFGDWNDGPSAPAVRVLRQGLSEDAALTRLSPTDSRGEAWTLYYKGGQEYSTFDQMFINKPLRKRMGRKYESGIIDIPAAAEASDHRALWCELK